MEKKQMINKKKQINFDGYSVDIGFYPKKIRNEYIRKAVKRGEIKVKKITECNKCGKPIETYFNGFLCGNCLKQWDIQRWARSLARHHLGKATVCMKCGLVTNKGIEWHHWDYSKPLDVISLCRKCHGLARNLSKEQFENINVKKRMDPLIKEDKKK